MPGGADVTQPTPGDSSAPNGVTPAVDGEDARAAEVSTSAEAAPAAERPIPIGCHPFVFGIVAATIQLVLTIFLLRSC